MQTNGALDDDNFIHTTIRSQALQHLGKFATSMMSAEVQVTAAQFRCKQSLDTVFVDGLIHNMPCGARKIQSGEMTRVTMAMKSSKVMMLTWAYKRRGKWTIEIVKSANKENSAELQLFLQVRVQCRV